VVSDCGAIDDLYMHHKVVKTAEEAAALAVKEGCDLNCGCTYEALVNAVKQGLIDEATIDTSLRKLFLARFRLGMFDPPEQVPYAQISIEVNDSAEHRALALRTARESMVLLKNAEGFLPLSKTLKRVAVIGPHADNRIVLVGNYNGLPSRPVTVLDGIRAIVSPKTEVLYARGCDVSGTETGNYADALSTAAQADVIIFVGGLSQLLEGEEGEQANVPPGQHSQGDRTDIDLPGVQEALLKALYATGKPVVLVLLNGSALAVNWADKNLPAILEAWYPGGEGGTAVAEVLFGDYNPAGRLPVTFYKKLDDLPPFRDYAMEGRTYRYFRGEALFPFGHGLSYTTFAYTDLHLSAQSLSPDQPLTVSVKVQNTGKLAGDEVVQLYVSDIAASVPVPIRSLQGFQRVHLAPGETKTVTFKLASGQFSLVDEAGQRVIEPGEFAVTVGGGQPLPGANVLTARVVMAG
jgi:beta-glucosidase